MSEPSARLRLRVSPGAARSEVVGPYGEGWKVRVAAPRERGRANEAVVELVARTVAVPRASVSLVAGASARDKVVVVKGLEQSDAERRLASSSRSADE
jgi:uncharacterized protein YggU (UPF0235/DUF167 family)